MWRQLALALVAAWFILGRSFVGAGAREAVLPPASEALHVLPPLGPPAWHVRNDPSLLPFVRVTVCRIEGEACPIVREFTGANDSEPAGPGREPHDDIVLGHGTYQVNWHLRHGEVGRAFRVSFDVAGLALGQVEVTPRTAWTVPIRFLIEANPRVRARALHAAGASPAQIAQALVAEFALSPVQVATVLAEEAFDPAQIAEALREVGFSVGEIARALLEGCGLDATAAAVALRAAGFGPAEIGAALHEVYGLDGPGVAAALRAAGYTAAEVAVVLKDVLGLGAGPAAQALKAAGYGAEDVYGVLRSVFGLDEAAAWAIVETLGYDEEQIFQARAGVLAIRFAPQLRFDGGGGTCSAQDSYPMSAQTYFEIRSQQTVRLSNGDASTVTGQLVPTYWKAFRCGRQYRIVYWFFYGYQFDCDCTSGEHDGDWEHLLVVLSEDKSKVAAVTFFQHSGYYTRLGIRDGFGLVDGTHPVVYPGRNGHGSYHNTQSAAQTCCYWEDHRDGSGPWLDTWVAPLRRLRPVAQGGEPWMDADLAGTFTWGEIGTHPMQNTSGDCGQQTCAGTPTWGCWESGCWRSQCEAGDRDDGITCWHCPPGYTEWALACTKCDCSGCTSTSVHTYGLRYTISMTDAGLMYKAP